MLYICVCVWQVVCMNAMNIMHAADARVRFAFVCVWHVVFMCACACGKLRVRLAFVCV